MHIGEVRIEGIKSHFSTVFTAEDYNTFVGENNCGKSNILFAIRWFFRDHVKLTKEDVSHTYNDDPSITIEFIFDRDDEIPSFFDEEYAIESNKFYVRAYCDYKKLDKKGSSPKYQLINPGKEPILLNVREIPKLVDIIFVPSIRELNSELKFTASSTINKLVTKYVIERVTTEEKKSNKYKEVEKAINKFSDYISNGKDSAFETLKTSLKEHMLDYNDVDICFSLEPPQPDELIKNSFEPFIKTKTGRLSIDSQGMGFQRSLIFSLICNVATIESDSLTKPTLYLIEEPELYLHPNHQNRFKNKLTELSGKKSNQVLITSHSPYFVNNITNYSQVKRIFMKNNRSILKEISGEDVSNICNNNGVLMATAKNECRSKKKKWKPAEFNRQAKNIADEDELRYLLWMDPNRANAFLSKKVLLVEGPTEKAFFSFMFHNKEGEFFKDEIINELAVVDVVGKYHFYKFAHLLSKLGISTWIMYDTDNNKEENGSISHKKLNEYIEKMNADDIIVDSLNSDPDLENALGIPMPNYSKDIVIYQKLVKDENKCKDSVQYNNIKEFIEKIIEY